MGEIVSKINWHHFGLKYLTKSEKVNRQTKCDKTLFLSAIFDKISHVQNISKN